MAPPGPPPSSLGKRPKTAQTGHRITENQAPTEAQPAGLRRRAAGHSSVHEVGTIRAGEVSDMDDAYELYCLTDPLFYDSFIQQATDEHDFEIARRAVPEDWERAVSGDWLMYMPRNPVLPVQGWKIHASASVDNAEVILEVVWEYCIARRIPFKFIRSRDLFFFRNVKYSPRSSSGKFIT